MSFPDMATMVGFYVVSRPFLDKNITKYAKKTHDQKMEVSMTLLNCKLKLEPVGCFWMLTLKWRTAECPATLKR